MFNNGSKEFNHKGLALGSLSRTITIKEGEPVPHRKGFGVAVKRNDGILVCPPRYAAGYFKSSLKE